MGKTGKKFFASILCSTIVTAAAAAAQAQAGPAGYYKGDDGNPTPGAAVDSSGNGNNGTYTGGATTSTTKAPVTFTNATSMQFNGTSAYVDVPTFSWPTGGPVTIAFWNNVTTAQVQNAITFTVGSTEVPSRFQAHAPWGDKRIYWDYGNLTEGRVDADYTSYLDKWTHVVLVSEGNSGTFKAIYLDGVEVASSTVSDGPDIALNGLAIGAWPAGAFHAGLIDDFRIYNSVLTPTQIAALAAGNTEPSAPAGLAATGGMNQVDLTWTPDPSASSFNLLWSTTSNGPYTPISVTGSSYTHTGLNNGTTYFYRISAVNAVGTGPNSSQVSATTLTPPPPPPRTQKLGSRHMCGFSSVGSGDFWGVLALAIAAALAFYRTRPSANLR
jgi:hypothetical protein